jgi:hypothetical protein
MKKTILICVVLMAAVQTFAQGSIKGLLRDTASRPLGLATITIFKASDTTLITYRLSNPEGEFKVNGLPLNLGLRAVITYSGYEAFRKEFTLENDQLQDWGSLVMTTSSRTLDEVLVFAERPPVTVKRDTIEFNASSFKTLPTALVEDLLKKLPGVQIDGEGNISANGRKVNRIMVDGKAFFGDDPKMATRNLPANVIDKVQVTEDKDEVNRNTTGDLTNVGKVINLTLKKGVKKGWFGKAYAGAGTSDRYEIGGIANIYRDTMQLSVLGFSNNLNRSGFSVKEVQDLGGFNRSGSNSMMMTIRGGQSGFAINGISFGGLEQGIARTSGAGFNLNHAPNKNRSYFIQYFMGNTRSFIDQLNNNQQFIQDTTVNTRLNTITHRNAFTHNFSTGAKLKPDTLTDIDFRASYSYAATRENIDANILVENNKTGLISQGIGDQFNRFYSNNYNHSIFLTRRARSKKGRTWNLNNTVNFNKNLQRYITESENEYFIPSFSEREFNQLRRQNTPGISSNTNLSYSEPITTKLTFRVNGRHEYLKDKQDIGIYDKDIFTSKYELMNFAQSSGFEREQHRAGIYSGLNYKIGQVTLGAGLTALWQEIENQFQHIPDPLKNSLFNILPGANLQWKQLSARYNMNVQAPGINYLNPVPDSTNPFYIKYGNPYLKPIRQHQIYISNFNFFQGSGTSYNIWINGNISNDDVVMSRTVKSNGVQEDRPVNANGSVQFWAGVGFGKEYKNKQKFIFSFRLSPNINYNRRKLLVNGNESIARTLGFSPNLNIGLNWNDIVEFRPSYSPGINRTTYTNTEFRNIKVITHYVESELIVRWPKKLVWETNLAYRNSNQVPPGMPRTNILWNAALTLLMFKGDVGLLKLSVYDILDRNNGLYRYTTQNQIVDNQVNVLQRYGALSFTYNIRNMGAPKKVGGRDRLFIF